MERRTFLQMLGTGVISLATGEARPVPLFSERDSALWTPQSVDLTRSHLVLTRPAATPLGADPGVLRLHRRWPVFGGVVLYPVDEPRTGASWGLPDASYWHNIPDVKIVLDDGEDPHEAFYKGAMKMREDFAVQSRRRLLAEPEPLRPHQQLVTLVDAPIFAGALETDERGFYLEISYTPYVVRAGGDVELNGWEVYSENGQYPVEVPSYIDMDHLLRIDRRVVTGEQPRRRLGGRLILPA